MHSVYRGKTNTGRSAIGSYLPHSNQLFLYGLKMTANVESIPFETIRSLINSFFSGEDLQDNESLANQIETGEILVKPEQLLPYLQTAFFEEHLLELQLDLSTRRYFANIVDSDIEKEQDELADEYEVGSYLKASEKLFITPLTPAIGNANIRTCKHIIVRFFMGTSAVELGCTFRGQDTVGDTPVLSLEFPVIGRINRNYRPYRVKTVSGVETTLTPLSPKSALKAHFKLEDISTRGMAFEVSSDKDIFEIGDLVRFKIEAKGLSELEIGGMVRHTSKVRSPQGYRYICGLQFDLETRALAANIERLTAAIQRLQLREIAEKVSDMRGVRIIK